MVQWQGLPAGVKNEAPVDRTAPCSCTQHEAMLKPALAVAALDGTKALDRVQPTPDDMCI